MSAHQFDSRSPEVGVSGQEPVEPGPSVPPAPPANQPGLCIFCKIREANWKSPTGHLACTQCRFSELHRVFSECYWQLMEIRATLDGFGDWLVDNDADYGDHR